MHSSKIIMQESIDITDFLRENSFLLLTNSKGEEIYDEDGNLYFYQAENGSVMSMPNIEEVRTLYELPLNPPEVKDIISRKDISMPNSLTPVPREESQIVWMGQKNDHCMKATKKLIELLKTPKYQTQMNNPNTVKLKVWEKIASELEANGFKIAPTTKEAGLRTFQKWRNMERTYWKFLRTNPEECGEDMNLRRKKPYFFDDLHPLLTKRAKEPTATSSCGTGDDIIVNVEDEELGVKSKLERVNLKRKRSPDGSDFEYFPREAFTLLTSLVTSPKYKKCLRDQPIKTKVWESICLDMTKRGWKFGNSIREGASVLAEKWRMVEKTILSKKTSGPRTLYTPEFRKAVLMEVEKRKALGPNYSRDPPGDSELTNSRRPKGGEIEREAIEVLLKVVGSGHYQNFFAKSAGRRAKIWEKIFEEVESQGYQIPGASKSEKVTRLFQKWRNMKRGFVKYQIAKSKGEEVKKPMFYEMLFRIISQEVMKMDNSECDSDEELKMDRWDEESDSECLIEFLDHDYGQTIKAKETVAVAPLQLPKIVEAKKTKTGINESSTQSSTACQPSTTRTSRCHEVLKQIKSLHEQSLAMQQQNFARVISLLENQISQQNRLTSVISEYLTNQTRRANMKKSQRMENSNHNNTKNGDQSSN